MTDVGRPGDDDLEVRLTWPDHEAGDPPPARRATDAAGDRAIEPYLDHVEQLRHQFDAEFRSQLARFESLAKAASDREERLANEVDSALGTIGDATAQSLERLGADITERLRDLEDESGAQQAELTRLGQTGQEELKRVFADHTGELDRLLGESDREMGEVVKRHVAEIERAISASAAEINEIADQRFAEFDRVVSSRVDVIEEATARSLTDIDAAIEHRIGDLEARLLAGMHAFQSQLAKGADAVARQGRLTLRFATMALVFAVIAVGLGVGLLLAR
jgi:hypothetical protein